MVPIEPVSLTIGAVALASLFSLCVQCFDLIEVAKNLGPESELLVVKLSIEKRRLMIWGEAVGVLRPDIDRDPLLDEQESRQLVEQILGNIQRLFYEAESLKSKYGLVTDASLGAGSAGVVDGSTVCTASFESSPIVQFQNKLFSYHGKVGIRAKTKWAIRDSKKFATLVQDLKDLVDGLSLITTSTSSVVHRGQLIRQEAESISDLRTLKVIESTCSDSDWRSSASAASEYFGNMNMLTTEKRKEISNWMDIDQGSVDGHQSQLLQPNPGQSRRDRNENLANLPPGSSQYQSPRLLAISEYNCFYLTRSLLTGLDRPYGGSHTEVLVLCSTSTLVAYLPMMDNRVEFHPVKMVPTITNANRLTASRMMKAIIVPPETWSPSVAIYCPPRMRYVHMALAILSPQFEPAYRFQIRFDDRLLDKDTVFSKIYERMVGYHKDIEAALETRDPVKRRIVDAIDVNWLEQRIDILSASSYTRPTTMLDWHTIFRQSRDDTSCVGIIVMAGGATCWDIFNTPPVIPPDVFKEGRVFRLRELDVSDPRSSYRWKAEHYCNVSEDRDFNRLMEMHSGF